MSTLACTGQCNQPDSIQVVIRGQSATVAGEKRAKTGGGTRGPRKRGYSVKAASRSYAQLVEKIPASLVVWIAPSEVTSPSDAVAAVRAVLKNLSQDYPELAAWVKIEPQARLSAEVTCLLWNVSFIPVDEIKSLWLDETGSGARVQINGVVSGKWASLARYVTKAWAVHMKAIGFDGWMPAKVMPSSSNVKERLSAMLGGSPYLVQKSQVSTATTGDSAHPHPPERPHGSARLLRGSSGRPVPMGDDFERFMDWYQCRIQSAFFFNKGNVPDAVPQVYDLDSSIVDALRAKANTRREFVEAPFIRAGEKFSLRSPGDVAYISHLIASQKKKKKDGTG